ncbi:hypothetical protein [Endozoicomonas sp. G2_2]|nr:hypothetical protein [Endozoicomonas sp. G2_2]
MRISDADVVAAGVFAVFVGVLCDVALATGSDAHAATVRQNTGTRR